MLARPILDTMPRVSDQRRDAGRPGDEGTDPSARAASGAGESEPDAIFDRFVANAYAGALPAGVVPAARPLDHERWLATVEELLEDSDDGGITEVGARPVIRVADVAPPAARRDPPAQDGDVTRAVVHPSRTGRGPAASAPAPIPPFAPQTVGSSDAITARHQAVTVALAPPTAASPTPSALATREPAVAVAAAPPSAAEPPSSAITTRQAAVVITAAPAPAAGPSSSAITTRQPAVVVLGAPAPEAAPLPSARVDHEHTLRVVLLNKRKAPTVPPPRIDDASAAAELESPAWQSVVRTPSHTTQRREALLVVPEVAKVETPELPTPEGSEDGMMPGGELDRKLGDLAVLLRYGHEGQVGAEIDALQAQYPRDLLMLRRIAEFWVATGHHEHARELLFSLATGLFERRNVEGMRQALEQVLVLDPGNERATRLIALLEQRPDARDR